MDNKASEILLGMPRNQSTTREINSTYLFANEVEQFVDTRNDFQGTIYYVDGNKITAGTGTGGWDNAFNTLSAAMAASHANIADTTRRAWASRNTIYVRADGITEDITKLCDKTDIIGVGSNDAYNGLAKITGSWIIPDTVSYIGCRFYNMFFIDSGASAIMDIDTQPGLEFHNCHFEATALTTIGLQIEESNFLVVDNCEFSMVSSTMAFTASAIKIMQDTDAIYDCKITNNIIMGAIGIDWDETASYNCWITDNYICSTGMTIDCEDDNVFVINNRLITDIDTTTSTAGYDFNIQLAAGNIQMGDTGLGDSIPFLKIAE